MKVKLALFSLCLSTQLSFATVNVVDTFNIDIANGLDGTRGILGPGGEPIPYGDGVVAVGTFRSLSDDAIRAANGTGSLDFIVSDFEVFGDITTVGIESQAANLAGVLGLVTTQDMRPDSVFAGRHVYTVVGSGATLEASVGLLVVKGEGSFLAVDGTPGPHIVNSSMVGLDPDRLLLGSFSDSRYELIPGEAATEIGTMTMAFPIPEPSAGLLVLVGIAGVVFSRRRPGTVRC